MDKSGLPNARILVVEDEIAMRTALADALGDAGYRVLVAENGERGLETALRESPDLLLVDVMMPRMDGFALCRELRAVENHAPVLLLTAKGQVEDRVAGLDAGADDYLVKPFSTAELLARVRALLRRTRRGEAIPDILQIGEARIDFTRQTCRRGTEEIALTAKEFAMLRLMAAHPGEPVTRDRFLDVVWGYAAFPTTRTVDNHIASLRAKLEPDPAAPRHIVTVHRVGYRLARNDEGLAQQWRRA